MKIWIITDTHLGHGRMVELCGRPADHSERILSNLAAMPDDGVLIHLGDVCMGNDDKWNAALLDALPTNFKAVLVRGNHDHKSDSWYYQRGWDFVCEMLSNTYFGKQILFSHAPLEKAGLHDINIHGHLHNSEHRLDEATRRWYDPGYHRKLALEETDYRPVLLETFLQQ
jgi:calcineurin-like phosphoesterase family protein